MDDGGVRPFQQGLARRSCIRCATSSRWSDMSTTPRARVPVRPDRRLDVAQSRCHLRRRQESRAEPRLQEPVGRQLRTHPGISAGRAHVLHEDADAVLRTHASHTIAADRLYRRDDSLGDGARRRSDDGQALTVAGDVATPPSVTPEQLKAFPRTKVEVKKTVAPSSTRGCSSVRFSSEPVSRSARSSAATPSPAT